MAYALLGIGLALLGVKIGFLHAGYGKISGCNSFIIPFLLYSIYHFMPTTPLPNWLTSCAFPIFLMHSIALSYFNIALKHLPILLAHYGCAPFLFYFVASAYAAASTGSSHSFDCSVPGTSRAMCWNLAERVTSLRDDP